MNIAFATCLRQPEGSAGDGLAARELAARGVAVRSAPWDAVDVDWAAFDTVVVRSCWDYHLHVGRFLDWVGGLERGGVPLWNPAPLVRWNVEKTYLRKLARDGVEVVASVFLEPGSTASFAEILDEKQWWQVVVKPLVSAAAYETWRFGREEAVRGQAALDRLRRAGGAIVQPFLDEVRKEGEWSLVFFRGAYSHAVLKTPRADDFRVQAEHGGQTHDLTPPAPLIAQARGALAAVPGDWLYARVDGVEVAGGLVVMELELIEPDLFLTANPDAPGRFADAILGCLPSGPGE